MEVLHSLIQSWLFLHFDFIHLCNHSLSKKKRKKHSYTDNSIPSHSALQRLSPSFLVSIKGGDCPPPLTVLPSQTVTSPLWLSSLHRLSPSPSDCPPFTDCHLHPLTVPFTDCHLHPLTVILSQTVTSTLWLSSYHRLSPPPSYCSLHRLSPPPSVIPSQTVTSTSWLSSLHWVSPPLMTHLHSHLSILHRLSVTDFSISCMLSSASCGSELMSSSTSSSGIWTLSSFSVIRSTSSWSCFAPNSSAPSKYSTWDSKTNMALTPFFFF